MARPSFDSVGSTSPSLIERVRQRDEEAWGRLVWLYGPLVDCWIRRKGVSRADAKDIFQEVFSAVASGIDGFRKDRPGDSFRAWLRVITRNKVNDHFRRAGRQPVAKGGTRPTPITSKPFVPEAARSTRAVSQRATQALSHSAQVGKLLTSTQSRIPPTVYARIWRQWQQNDTQIQADVRELESLYTSSARKAALVEEIDDLRTKNAEIERLVAQYG